MIGTTEVVATLLQPERLRLVEALRRNPDSAAGLARRLGESRQRLNYHLRRLEEAGAVELVEERRRGNFTERVYRAVARRFVVDPALLGDDVADPGAAGDRHSAGYVVALAARAVREVAGLGEKAAEEGRRLATAGLETRVRLARPADFEAFVHEVAEAVADVVARHHDEGSDGRPFRVFLGAYPTGEKEAEDE